MYPVTRNNVRTIHMLSAPTIQERRIIQPNTVRYGKEKKINVEHCIVPLFIILPSNYNYVFRIGNK